MRIVRCPSDNQMAVSYYKFEPVELEKSLGCNYKFASHQYINSSWNHEIGLSLLGSQSRERRPRGSPGGLQLSHEAVLILRQELERWSTGGFTDKREFEEPRGRRRKAKGEWAQVLRQKAGLWFFIGVQHPGFFPEEKTRLGLSTARCIRCLDLRERTLFPLYHFYRNEATTLCLW